MNTSGKGIAALLAILALSASVHAVAAADMSVPADPVADAFRAVSAVNGSLELFGGAIDPGTGTLNGQGGLAGSLTVPVGDALGLQGDILADLWGGDVALGGGAHLFTRNPSSYLFGLAGGAVRHNGTTLWGVGPEAELYLDRVSLEAFAGFGGIDYPTAPDVTGVFGFVDLAWYPTDDLRLAVGGSSVFGANALHAGGEYQVQNGASLTGDLRAGGGAYSATAGLKFYFGDGTQKSLIERHRQDDPGGIPQKFTTGGGGNWTEPATAEPSACPPGYHLNPESYCVLND